DIVKQIRKHIDLTPRGIIDRFKLLRPIYEQTSFYGHMGREDLGLPWEELDSIKYFKELK
ncbi:MAG: methionine adenosyltransferase domain-containing protein, partial [Acholeplasmataceae bacterium]|nr:methionine adenosyltransferase domain-containing protein [Acholeplasmataceae bacterium]